MSEKLVWAAYCLILLQCVIVGLLIWHKRFGCYSRQQREQEEERIASLVMRQVYEHEKARVYREWDETHRMNGRNQPPDNAEEDCA